MTQERMRIIRNIILTVLWLLVTAINITRCSYQPKATVITVDCDTGTVEIEDADGNALPLDEYEESQLEDIYTLLIDNNLIPHSHN